MKTLGLVVALALLAPLTAHAQEINLSSLDEEPNRVHVTTGAEYGFIASAGYSRILPFLDRRVVLTGEATLPWASLDLADFGVRAQALVPIVGSARWKLAGAFSPAVRATENKVNRMVDAGVDVGLVGGLYTDSWFVALESGVDLLLATHVTHSDSYRMLVHPGAQDGWYGNAGGNLRGGLQAGVAFSRYDVILRAGQVRDVGGGPPLIPFYGTLTMDARW
ncbi:MAG: hypothetical protein F9K40_14465 [Kofleriaceae bacterium]|nr:MAG: hypothetical protein F9K40_14465 [Kofleriaceae bacterium]MBZ0233787.1 hypothetical protein [Kofleriaceae bacterium]